MLKTVYFCFVLFKRFNIKSKPTYTLSSVNPNTYILIQVFEFFLATVCRLSLNAYLGGLSNDSNLYSYSK